MKPAETGKKRLRTAQNWTENWTAPDAVERQAYRSTRTALGGFAPVTAVNGIWRALRLATEGDENGFEQRDVRDSRGRWRPVAVWHCEAVCECGPERFLGREE